MQLRRASRVWASPVSAGQGLLEFALIIPVFMLVVVGALDFGMAFHAKVVLTNAAREGANFMVYHSEEDVPAAFSGTKAAVMAEGGTSGLNIDESDIVVRCLLGGVDDPDCSKGSTAVVSVTHQLELLVEVLFRGPLVLTAEARMMIP